MGAYWKKLGFVVARRPADFNKHKNFQIVVFFPSLHLLASRGRSAAIKYRSTKKKQKKNCSSSFFLHCLLPTLAQAMSKGKQGRLSFISEAMIMGRSQRGRGKEIFRNLPPVDIWCSCGKCLRVCVATSRTSAADFNRWGHLMCSRQPLASSCARAELQSAAQFLTFENSLLIYHNSVEVAQTFS